MSSPPCEEERNPCARKEAELPPLPVVGRAAAYLAGSLVVPTTLGLTLFNFFSVPGTLHYHPKLPTFPRHLPRQRIPETPSKFHAPPPPTEVGLDKTGNVLCSAPLSLIFLSFFRFAAVLHTALSLRTRPAWTLTLWSTPPRLTPDDHSRPVPLVMLTTAPRLLRHLLRRISGAASGALLLRRTPPGGRRVQPGTGEQSEKAGLVASERLKSEEPRPVTLLLHRFRGTCCSRTWLSLEGGCGASGCLMGRWSRCIVRRWTSTGKARSVAREWLAAWSWAQCGRWTWEVLG